jgi:hypothetical protein
MSETFWGGWLLDIVVGSWRIDAVKYIVRLNPRAYNPVTHQLIKARLWEVEQCANKDSEKVIWHCAEVRINGTPMRSLFTLPKDGEKPFEVHASGIVARGYDDAIEIMDGGHEVD